MTRYRTPSASTLKVLTFLSAAGKGQHGYAIMQATDLASGTLYPILMRLSERGWLEKNWDLGEGADSGPPRRIYTLTAEGHRQTQVLMETSSGQVKQPRGVTT